MSGFTDDMSLGDARDLLRTMVDRGADCPCCRQYAKVYPFKLNGSMAEALARLYVAGGRSSRGLVDITSLGWPHRLHGHFSKLRFWGFIERPPELRREDGSTRVGLWRVTPSGEGWVTGRSRCPARARIYNNRCLGLVGEPVAISEVIPVAFNYAELMHGA